MLVFIVYLCTRSYSTKCCEVRAITIPTLQMRKLRLWDMEGPLWSWDLHQAAWHQRRGSDPPFPRLPPGSGAPGLRCSLGPGVFCPLSHPAPPTPRTWVSHTHCPEAFFSGSQPPLRSSLS